MPQEKIFKIKVIPRSKKNQIVERGDNYLKIKLTAPPIKGKANEALRKFIAEEFKIPKSAIKITKGEKGREKIVRIIK